MFLVGDDGRGLWIETAFDYEVREERIEGKGLEVGIRD